MSPDEAIHAFAVAGHDLPRDAMQWAIDHWDEAAPSFVALLSAMPAEPIVPMRRGPARRSSSFTSSAKRETTAFASLCKLMRQAQALEDILGDAITELLTNIVISTFDGNAGALKAVIEAEDAGEFVRLSTIQALAYVTRIGKWPDDEMRAYLLHLLGEMPRRRRNAPPGCGPGQRGLQPRLRGICAEGRTAHPARLPPIGLDDGAQLPAGMRCTLDDPEDGRIRATRIGPFVDAIGMFEAGASSRRRQRPGEARRAAPGAERADEPEDEIIHYVPNDPYVNPLRAVGRNDPCPCGSGEKYKRCCLGKLPAPEGGFARR